MKIKCTAGCQASQTDPKFTASTTVVLRADMTIWNRDLCDVPLEDVTCAYCEGGVEEEDNAE